MRTERIFNVVQPYLRQICRLENGITRRRFNGSGESNLLNNFKQRSSAFPGIRQWGKNLKTQGGKKTILFLSFSVIPRASPPSPEYLLSINMPSISNELEREFWKRKFFLSAASRVNSVWQLWTGDIDLYWHKPLFAAESQSESTRGSSAFFNKIQIFCLPYIKQRSVILTCTLNGPFWLPCLASNPSQDLETCVNIRHVWGRVGRASG